MRNKDQIRRIFGLESEIMPRYFFRDERGELQFSNIIPYGPAAQLMLAEKESPASVFLFFLRHAIPGVEDTCNSRIFLPENECLIYPDVGHVEATTPECLSPKDVVRYSIALRRFLLEYLAKFNAELPHGEVTLVNNTGEFPEDEIDFAKSPLTRGAHENYSVPVEAIPGKRFPYIEFWLRVFGRGLSSFFVTRQIVCGNGAVYPAQNTFLLSQRSPFIVEEQNSTTTMDRAILNTKPEPLSDGNHMRLHVIVGDANLAEWSIYLKFALTSIVLSMLTDEYLVGDYLDRVNVLGNRVHALHRVCFDTTCKEKTVEVVRGNDRTAISALDHQIQFLELMQDYGRHTRLLPWEKDAIAKYEYVLRNLERGNLAALSDKLDWVIKKTRLDRVRQKRNITDYKDPLCAMYDHQYHELHPERGIFLKLQEKDLVRRITTERDIVHALHHPPPTRALWRKVITAQLLKQKADIGYICSGYKDWQEVHQGRITVKCHDPFVLDLRKILDHQIARIKSLTTRDFGGDPITILER
jgi:proteasome accessory factor A